MRTIIFLFLLTFSISSQAMVSEEAAIMIRFSGNKIMSKAFENQVKIEITSQELLEIKANKGLNGWANCVWSEDGILENYDHHYLNELLLSYWGEWFYQQKSDDPAFITLNADCPRTFVINMNSNFALLRGSFELNSAGNYASASHLYSSGQLELKNGELLGKTNDFHIVIRKIKVGVHLYYAIKVFYPKIDQNSYSLYYYPQ